MSFSISLSLSLSLSPDYSLKNPGPRLSLSLAALRVSDLLNGFLLPRINSPFLLLRSALLYIWLPFVEYSVK